MDPQCRRRASRGHAPSRAGVGHRGRRDRRASKRTAKGRSREQRHRREPRGIGSRVMTAWAHRSYRFKTAAQWSACLFDRADQAAGLRGGLRPIAPYQQSAQLYKSPGARPPAATRSGDILWHDDIGQLHRLMAHDDEPQILRPAPYEIAHAARLLPMSSGLWAVSKSKTSLQRYEEDTLTRLAVVDIPGARVIDVAGDGYDLLFALVERAGVMQAVRIDCSGRIVDTVTFEGIANASAFVFLRRFERFVVLAGGPPPPLHS